MKMAITDTDSLFEDLPIEIRQEETLNDTESALLCIHCKRTKNNGIRCLGMCVADNDY